MTQSCEQLGNKAHNLRRKKRIQLENIGYRNVTKETCNTFKRGENEKEIRECTVEDLTTCERNRNKRRQN